MGKSIQQPSAVQAASEQPAGQPPVKLPAGQSSSHANEAIACPVTSNNRFVNAQEGSVFEEYDCNKDTLLILFPERYIVYVDEDNHIWWESLHSYDVEIYDKYIGSNPDIKEKEGLFWLKYHILARKSINHLNWETGNVFRCIVAAGLARLFEGLDPTLPLRILDEADSFIKAREQEKAREWYLQGSMLLAIPIVILVFLLWSLHYSYPGSRIDLEMSTGKTGLVIILGVGWGALGAWLSVLQRVGASHLNPSAGKRVHIIEGGARVVVGVLGGKIVLWPS